MAVRAETRSEHQQRVSRWFYPGGLQRLDLFALSEFFEGKTIVSEFEVSANKLRLRDDHYADGHLREWHMSLVECSVFPVEDGR